MILRNSGRGPAKPDRYRSLLTRSLAFPGNSLTSPSHPCAFVFPRCNLGVLWPFLVSPQASLARVEAEGRAIDGWPLWRGVHDERAAAAEAHGLGDRLVAVVAEDLQRRRVARIVVKRQYRPGGQGELLAELTGQLLRQRAVVEVGLSSPDSGTLT